MHGQWLTYSELGVGLSVSVEAARRRALRAKWARQPGNDGRTRVMLPDDWRPQGTPGVRPGADEAQARVAADTATIKALEGHVETLKAQLAAAEARDAQFVAEQAKTEKAIEAFSALAQRLEAMAAQHAIKPWWQRLLRRA